MKVEVIGDILVQGRNQQENSYRDSLCMQNEDEALQNLNSSKILVIQASNNLVSILKGKGNNLKR